MACDGVCFNDAELAVIGPDLFGLADCAEDGIGIAAGPTGADVFVIVKLGLGIGKCGADCGLAAADAGVIGV